MSELKIRVPVELDADEQSLRRRIESIRPTINADVDINQQQITRELRNGLNGGRRQTIQVDVDIGHVRNQINLALREARRTQTLLNGLRIPTGSMNSDRRNVLGTEITNQITQLESLLGRTDQEIIGNYNGQINQLHRTMTQITTMARNMHGGFSNFNTTKAYDDLRKIAQVANQTRDEINSLGDVKGIEQLRQQNQAFITELERTYQAFSRLRDQQRDNGLVFSDDFFDFDSQLKRLHEMSNQIKVSMKDFNKSAIPSSEEATFATINQKIARMEWLRENYSRAFKDKMWAADFNRIFAGFNSADASKNLQVLIKDLSTLEMKARATGLAGKTAMQGMMDSFQKFAGWFEISQIFMKMVETLGKMVTNVKEVNTAMTDLRKVTNESEADYQAFLNSATKRSADMSAKITDYIGGTNQFARLGYGVEDAQKLGEVATIYNQVGDDIEGIEDASGSIIATMKAFNIEADQAITIVDKFNTAGNNYAVSSGDVGAMLQRSAAALAAAGNDINESIAMGTAMAEVNRDAEKSGAALKVLALRLRGAKTELASLGEDTDDMAISTSKLREQILGLTNIDGTGGFDIMDEDGFKSTYEMIDGIAKAFNQMDEGSENAAALLELIAGKNRASDVSGMLKNWDTARAVYEDMLKAEGSAMKEYTKWQDSIEAKEKKVASNFERLSINLLDEDALKIGYDLLNGFLEILNKITEVAGGLPAILSVGMAALSQFKPDSKLLPFQQVQKADGESILAPWFLAPTYRKNEFKERLQADASILEQYRDTSDEAQRSALKNRLSPYTLGVIDFEAMNNGLEQANIQISSYRDNIENATKKTFSFGASLASIGKSLGTMGLEALVSILLSKGIEALYKWYDTSKNASKYAIEDAEAMTASWEKAANSQKQIQTLLDKYGERYEELRLGAEKGVFNAEEAKEYAYIVNQFGEAFPDLVTGWDDQGNAILQVGTTVDTLKQKYDELIAKTKEAQSSEFYSSVFEGAMARLYSKDKGSYTEYLNILKEREEFDKVLKDTESPKLDQIINIAGLVREDGHLDKAYYEEIANAVADNSPYEKLNEIDFKEIVKSYLAAYLNSPDVFDEVFIKGKGKKYGFATDGYNYLWEYLLGEDTVNAMYGHALNNSEFQEWHAQLQRDGSLNKYDKYNFDKQTREDINTLIISASDKLIGYTKDLTADVEYLEILKKAVSKAMLGFDSVENSAYAQAQADLVDLQDEYARMIVNGFSTVAQSDIYGGRMLSGWNVSEEMKNFLMEIPYKLGHEVFGYGLDTDQDGKATAYEYRTWFKDNFLVPLAQTNAQSAMEGIFSAQNDFVNGDLNYAGLKSYMDTMANEGRNLFGTIGADGTNPIGEMIWGIISDLVFKEYGELVQKAQQLGLSETEATSLDVEKLNYIRGMGLEDGTLSGIADLEAKIAEVGAKEAASIDVLTESYTKLNEARNQAQTNLATLSEQGFLTSEQMREVMAAGYSDAIKETQYGTQYVDYQKMRQIDLEQTQKEINTLLEAGAEKVEEAKEAYKSYFDYVAQGKKDEAQIQLDTLNRLDEETKTINRMIDSLRGATTALKAFQAASEMGELGDNFRATKAAIDAINEGLKSGRIGTNKFRAAIELIGGEQMLDDFQSGKIGKSDLQTYIKNLGKYYDSDGNIDRSKVFDLLAKKDVGYYFKEDGKRRFALNKDASMQDIQDAFGGISKELATYLLDAVNEFALNKDEILGPDEYKSDIDKRQEELQKVQNMAVQAASVTISAENLNEPNKDVPSSTASEKTATEFSLDVVRGLFDLKTALDRTSNVTEEQKSVLQSRLNEYASDEAIMRNVDLAAMVSGLQDAINALVVINETSPLDGLKSKYGDHVGILGAAGIYASDVNYSANVTPKMDEGGKGLVAKALEDLKDKETVIEVQVEADTKKAEQEIENLGDAAKKELILPVEANVDEARARNEEVVEEIVAVSVKPVDADTRAALEKVAQLDSRIATPIVKPVNQSAIAAAIGQAQLLNKLLAKPIVKPFTIGGGGAGSFIEGGGVAGVDGGIAKVNGGKALVSGNTLVGEIAPEIIVDRKTGTWRLVEYPQLTRLNSGDIVFNGNQTKAILEGKKTSFSQALVDGNAKGGKSYAVGAGVHKFVAVNDAVGSISADDIRKRLAGLQDSIERRNNLKNSSQDASDNKKSKGSGGGSGSSGGGGGYSEPEEIEYDWKDWIVRVLEIAKKETEKAIEDVAEKVGYIAKNAQLNAALKKNETEIKKNEAAYKRYLEQADLMKDRHGLSDDIVNKIQNGTIDITEYEQDMLDKISDYEKWYEKAIECKDAVEELKKQELELNRQKLDSISEFYDNKIARLEARLSKNSALLDKKAAYGEEIVVQDYVDAVAATQDKITQLQEERAAYAKQFDELVASGYLEPESDAWFEYIETLEDIDESIIETTTDLVKLKDEIADIPLTNLIYAYSRLEAVQERIEAFRSFHDAQGTDNSSNTLIDLINNAFEEIENLEQQNEILYQQQTGLDVLSEKWQSLQEEIEKNEQAIWDIKSSQEEWNDAIIDLQVEKLQKEREELEKSNEALEKRKEMEDALEDLEKARQRTKLIYRENIGFVYEADRDAIKDAQDRVDELRHQEMIDKIDEAIDALEESKKDDNVYDYEGIDVLKAFVRGSGESLYDLVHTNTNLDNLLADKGYTISDVSTQAGAAPFTIQIGDITLQGVQDVDAFAQSIVNELPNKLIQKLYS